MFDAEALERHIQVAQVEGRVEELRQLVGGESLAHLRGLPDDQLEVLSAVRVPWPAERPLAVRLLADDLVRGGLTAADGVALARRIAEAGADLVDVAAGHTVPEAGAGVIEVNASPGFEGLEAATKQNIAKLFVEAAVKAARGRT